MKYKIDIQYNNYPLLILIVITEIIIIISERLGGDVCHLEKLKINLL